MGPRGPGAPRSRPLGLRGGQVDKVEQDHPLLQPLRRPAGVTLELWKSPPFKPEIRDGRLYGRGVSDDKGELVSRLKLVESYIKENGEPPCNVKLCFEGEEEVGSGHLEEYVDKNPDLFKSDGVIWEYGKIGGDGRPVVGLGVKGMIYLDLTVRSLSQDAHSMYAAALPSAVWRLVRLLGIIKDPNERILIPGWYDKVHDLSEEELKLLEEQPSEAQELLKTYGSKEFVGGMPLSQAKKALVARPTANVAGIWAGYTGPGSKTVLPAEAHCKMDFRLVPNQDPHELYSKLVAYLAANGFGDVEIAAETMEPAARTSYKSDLAQAAIKGAKEVFGNEPDHRDLERRDRSALHLHEEIRRRGARHRNLTGRRGSPLAEREHPVGLPREGDALARPDRGKLSRNLGPRGGSGRRRKG